MGKRKDTFPLQKGEWYIYEGKNRGKGWNSLGYMDFILEKKPLKVMEIKLSEYWTRQGALVRFKYQRMAWYLTFRECQRFQKVDAPKKEDKK